MYTTPTRTPSPTSEKAIKGLFVDDEEDGPMRNPEAEFLSRWDETREDDDSEEEYEDGNSQKDGGSVEMDGPLEEDDDDSEEE